MNIKEEWRPVRDYEGLYSVSSLGNIRNDKRTKVLKPAVLRHQTLVVLYKHNISRTYTVARLVAEAFIPVPNDFADKPIVAKHRNKNAEYIDSVANLYWDIDTSNIKRHGNSKGVVCKNDNMSFKSISDAAEYYNLPNKELGKAIADHSLIEGKLFEVKI